MNTVKIIERLSGRASTYYVDGKITNAERNEISNPVYDANEPGKQEVETAVPLKYQSNFWRGLSIPLVNCKMSLILIWSREQVITSIERRVITLMRRDTSLKNASFQIKDKKLYVAAVTLSTGDDNKFLEQLKSGFKSTTKWKKYRSEMTN